MEKLLNSRGDPKKRAGGGGNSVGKGFTGCTLPVSITQLLVPVIGHIIPVCIMEVFLLVLV